MERELLRGKGTDDNPTEAAACVKHRGDKVVNTKKRNQCTKMMLTSIKVSMLSIRA